jgi:2'-5' RNA ligase
VRCFIAVDVPDAVREALLAAQAALRARLRHADVRWVGSEQLHLTLKFLGAVPDDRVPAISAALDGVTATALPLSLTAAGLGAFPSPGSARVIWGGITAGGTEAAALAGAADAATAVLGFARETRPFRSHLTLGRVRSRRGVPGLATAIRAAGEVVFGAWEVLDIVLYESRLRPTGALYLPVTRHALRGARR